MSPVDPLDHDHQPPGPLALVIQPGGTCSVERLPASALAAATRLHDLIGGHYEAIGYGDGDWTAYTMEDERDFGPQGPLPNAFAYHLAIALGWRWAPGDYAKGVYVFLGKEGTTETDCPSRIINATRTAGLIK
jgi:hypothetical protein